MSANATDFPLSFVIVLVVLDVGAVSGNGAFQRSC